MTDVQDDYYSMLGVLRTFFEHEGVQILAVLPAFGPERATFDALLNAIEASAVAAGPDTTGYAEERGTKRMALLTDVALVGAACIYYHTHTAPDAEVVNRLKRCLRNMSRQNAADLTVNSRTVWETADGVKTLLAPYGISAGDVDALLVKLEKWEDLREAPLDIRATTKRHRAQMVQGMADMRVFLRERMDQLFKVLQVKETLLYNQYRGARKIKKKRGRRAADKPYKVLLNPAATKSLRLRASIKAGDTKIKLSTHTKTATTDVVVFFCATAAGPQQGEGLVLQPNSKVETTATLLGWTAFKPHLCAKNLGVGRHTVGVVIVG